MLEDSLNSRELEILRDWRAAALEIDGGPMGLMLVDTQEYMECKYGQEFTELKTKVLKMVQDQRHKKVAVQIEKRKKTMAKKRAKIKKAAAAAKEIE